MFLLNYLIVEFLMMLKRMMCTFHVSLPGEPDREKTLVEICSLHNRKELQTETS